ncbi:hypothetical protein [Caballeronia insecticola]|uniref:Uncharacterized protein n=1 Tax=Caballeronia insecticola TaxID=758793 RepID=R4WRE1_9BURK|nr:hypothetical protein [Caballeronia insecticola]BAN27139.1 hypothetical protein BRPE64_DCDS02030 [Caballeronia insecticola]
MVTSIAFDADGGVPDDGVLAPDGALAPLGDDAADGVDAVAGLDAGATGLEAATAGLEAAVAGLDAAAGLDADVVGLEAAAGLDGADEGLAAGAAPPVVAGASELELPPLHPATTVAKAKAIAATVKCPFICGTPLLDGARPDALANIVREHFRRNKWSDDD